MFFCVEVQTYSSMSVRMCLYVCMSTCLCLCVSLLFPVIVMVRVRTCVRVFVYASVSVRGESAYVRTCLWLCLCLCACMCCACLSSPLSLSLILLTPVPHSSHLLSPHCLTLVCDTGSFSHSSSSSVYSWLVLSFALCLDFSCAWSHVPNLTLLLIFPALVTRLFLSQSTEVSAGEQTRGHCCPVPHLGTAKAKRNAPFVISDQIVVSMSPFASDHPRVTNHSAIIMQMGCNVLCILLSSRAVI